MSYKNVYSDETRAKARELRLQGVPYAAIAEQLGIHHETARFLCRGIKLTKEQRRNNAHRKHSKETELEVAKLREEGKPWAEIAETLSLPLDYVKMVCRRYRILLSRETKTKNSLEGMKKKRPNHMQEIKALAFTPEAIAKRRKFPVEMEQEIVRLRLEGITRQEVAKRLGVKQSYVKTVCIKHKITLPDEIKHRNVHAARRAKNPNYMQEFAEKGRSPEALVKRRASLKATYSDPELRKRKGQQSSSWWLSLSEQEKEEMLRERQVKTENSPKYRQYMYRFIGAAPETDLKTAFEAKIHEYANSHGGKFLGEYLGSKTKVEFVCSDGHEFKMIPNAILRGVWCARCANVGPSKGQIEVYDYVRSLVPGLEVILGDRAVLNRKELDIYIPAKKFAIEYNGLYFHSSAVSSYVRGRHRKKALACNEAGVALLAIFEDEWADPNKRELLKAMIRWRLGKSTAKPLDARKLEMCELSYTQEVVDFFERNHLDGCVRFAFGLGLRHEGRLVCCAVFRKNFVGEFELARLATDQDFSVRGGASRLISKAPRPLVSYSNNRLSHGDVYKKLGFEFVQENPSPSYWYTDSKVRVWRWNCRKVNDPEVVAQYPTEELQALNGVHSQRLFGDSRPLYRIEDYGHKKWILR